MTKTIFALLLVLTLLVAAQEALAENPDAPELANPIAAMKVSLPDAQLNYALKEREDGRYEWKMFFEMNDVLGVCEIFEDTNTIRKVEMYERGNENALTADQAVKKLIEEKGSLTVTELELDWDDGQLRYEGDAEIDGKRYEFEMTAEGRIIEWERD